MLNSLSPRVAAPAPAPAWPPYGGSQPSSRASTPRGGTSPRYLTPVLEQHTEKEMIAEARERIQYNRQKNLLKNLLKKPGYGHAVDTKSLILAAKIARVDVPDAVIAETHYAVGTDRFGAPSKILWKPFLREELAAPPLRGAGNFGDLPPLRRELEAMRREAAAKAALEEAARRAAEQAAASGPKLSSAAKNVKPKDVDHWFKFMQNKMKDRFTEVRRAFRLLDADFSGSLTHDEFKSILGMFNIETAIPAEVFERILAIVDKNGDGTITFEEFSRLTTVESVYDL